MLNIYNKCSEIVSSYFEYFSRQSFWTMVGQLMFKPFFQTLKFAAMFEHKHLKALKIKEIFTSLSYQTHNSYSVNDLKLLVTSSTTPRKLKRIKSCSYPEAVETVNINFIIISYWHLLIWSTWLWESHFGIVIVFFICKLFCTFLKVQLTNYTHHILVATSEGAVCQHTIEGVSMTLLTILMICFIV